MTAIPECPIKIPFQSGGLDIDLSKYPDNILLCGLNANQEWILIDLQHDLPLFYNNGYVRNSSKICTEKELKSATITIKTALTPKQLVIFLPADIRLFQEKYISNFEEFYQMITIIDQFQLNHNVLSTFSKYRLWILDLVNCARQQWNETELLLKHSYDAKKFYKPKFTQPAQRQPIANDDYPAFNQAHLPTHNVRMRSIVPKTDIDPNMLVNLVELLVNNSDKFFLPKLLIFILVSFEYPQVILERKELVTFFSTNFPDIFYSAIGYSLRIYYLEECSRYITTKHSDRFLLNLDILSGLDPLTKQCDFPSSPYNVTSLCLRNLNYKNLTLPYYLAGNSRGIYSKEMFRKRLELFAPKIFSESQTEKAFPWIYKTKSGNVVKSVLCGSTITACLCRNPLEIKTTVEYFAEYYPEQNPLARVKNETSDLSHPIPGFSGFSGFSGFFGLLEENTDIDETEDSPQTRLHTVSGPRDTPRPQQPRHRVYRENSDEEIEESESQSEEESQAETETESDDDEVRIIEPGAQAEPGARAESGTARDRFLADIDIMVETESLEDFDEVAQAIFVSIKSRDQYKKNTIELVREVTENKHKWKITGLARQLDIFSVNSIPGVIVKFHLPCVRAYYDGTNVFGFPSFLAAANTGINQDIRWISCNKDVREIVLKYFQRGYGTLLNRDDSETMIRFINDKPGVPAFHPPGDNNWRINRYWNRPLFIQNKNMIQNIFNPITGDNAAVSKLSIKNVTKHMVFSTRDVNKEQYRQPITDKGYQKMANRQLKNPFDHSVLHKYF